jgi:hypothetical protein
MGCSDRSLLASGGWIGAGMAILFVVAGSSDPAPPNGAAALVRREKLLVAVTAGLLVSALIGFFIRRDAPAVPPLMIAGVVILAL